jgi:hypothetical protein
MLVQMIVMVAAIAGSKPDNVPKTVPTLTMSPMTFSDSVRWEAAMALLRWCYGQLTFCDKLHHVGVICVSGIKWAEVSSAITVEHDANHIAFTILFVLGVFIHLKAPRSHQSNRTPS